MSYVHGKSVIKIAVADDQEMFREAISAAIDDFENCKVIIQASNGIELLEKLEQKPITDLALLDVAMPGMDGIDTAIKIRSRFPEIKVIFCSVYNTELAICRMIGTGAQGYIDKACSINELKRTIVAVMKKETGHEHANGRLFFYEPAGSGQHDIKNYKLTDNEVIFIKLICTEKPYKEIAKEMGMSDRQVDYIREGLFYRFDVHSRIGLAIIAVQSGVRNLVSAVKTFFFLFHLPLEFYP